MTYGLRCRDSSGNITLDITDRLSRVLLEFTIPINQNTGQITLPSNRSGDVWVIFNARERRVQGIDFAVPIATYSYTISGNVLNWNRIVRVAPTLPVHVIVGIY